VVRLGSKIKPSYVKKAPVVRVSCPNAQDVMGFTVALTDPDAPSRKNPEWSEMCHWIVIVPTTGASLQDGEVHWYEESEAPNEIVECMGLPLILSFPFSSSTESAAPLCIRNDRNRQTSRATFKNWLSPLRFCPSRRRQQELDWPI
jgi:hypothetical protein